MLLMVEEGIRGGMCQTICRYAKANNKYMENYDKNIKSSYVVHLDANNLYGWAMSQKLPVNGFKWVKKLTKFDKRFIKNYDENSNLGSFLEVMQSIQKIHLIFIKIHHFYEKEKYRKSKICDIEDRKKYVAHIRALKQASNHGGKLKKTHRVIQLN